MPEKRRSSAVVMPEAGIGAIIGQMMTLRARFDGRVLVPDEPVDLPRGRTLEVQVREVEESGPVAGNGQCAELPTFQVAPGAKIIRLDDVRRGEDEP
jgi:hypothetical protein